MAWRAACRSACELTVPVAVPNGDDVYDYPIRLTIAAEGTEGAVIYDFPLKVGREPNR